MPAFQARTPVGISSSVSANESYDKVQESLRARFGSSGRKLVIVPARVESTRRRPNCHQPPSLLISHHNQLRRSLEYTPIEEQGHHLQDLVLEYNNILNTLPDRSPSVSFDLIPFILSTSLYTPSSFTNHFNTNAFASAKERCSGRPCQERVATRQYHRQQEGDSNNHRMLTRLPPVLLRLWRRRKRQKPCHPPKRLAHLLLLRERGPPNFLRRKETRVQVQETKQAAAQEQQEKKTVAKWKQEERTIANAPRVRGNATKT